MQVKALESRMFYMPSFKIYGGVAGLYDYGPPGSALKANVTQFWRQHFVMQEGMLEVECPAVTPHCVLKASGHVDRFEDFMITDTVTGDPIRADHLLEAWLERMLEDKTTTADAAAVCLQPLHLWLDSWTLQDRCLGPASVDTDLARMLGDSAWKPSTFLAVVPRVPHDVPASSDADISIHTMPARPAPSGHCPCYRGPCCRALCGCW